MSSSDAEPAFDIDSQLAHNISNIGGNQTIHYGDRSRAARVGKAMAVVGLLLSLAGLALFVLVAVTTTRSALVAVHGSGLEVPYTQYLAAGWAPAVGLLVGGFVVNRFARIIVGR